MDIVCFQDWWSNHCGAVVAFEAAQVTTKLPQANAGGLSCRMETSSRALSGTEELIWPDLILQQIEWILNTTHFRIFVPIIQSWLCGLAAAFCFFMKLVDWLIAHQVWWPWFLSESKVKFSAAPNIPGISIGKAPTSRNRYRNRAGWRAIFSSFPEWQTLQCNRMAYCFASLSLRSTWSYQQSSRSFSSWFKMV